MRHILLGFVAVVLGVGAVTATPAPAQAQGFSITVGEPYGHRPVRRWERSYERPVYGRHGYGRHGYERHGYGRHGYERHGYERRVYERPVPAYRAYPQHARPAYYAAPRCTIRTARVWDGYGWIVKRREICR